jgi:4-aminobutyrate aminotransferase-like enzyme
MSCLNEYQINDLLISHCNRVIENMNHDDLLAYAHKKMMESFDKDPGQGNTDVAMLIADIIRAEGGDKDSASEFICGCRIDGEIADRLVDEH